MARTATPRDATRPLKVALILALLAATAVFVGLRLRASAIAIDAQIVRAHATELAVAVLLVILATLALGLTWSMLVQSLDARLGSRARLLATFAYTWIARYIPGTLPALAGRVYAASGTGHRTRPLIVATGLQSALEVVVASAYGLAMLVIARRGAFDPVAWSAVMTLTVVLIVATHARTLDFVARLGRRLLRRPQNEGEAPLLPPSRAMFCATIGILVCQLLMTAGLLVSIAAVEPVAISDFAHVAAAVSLSGVAGMLIVLAPAGFGVRDAAMVALLAPIMPVESAALVVVLFRAVTIAADVLVGGAAFAWDRSVAARVGVDRNAAVATEAVSLERR